MFSLRFRLSTLLDTLLPITCVACACRGAWLCAACWQRTVEPRPFTCIGCGREDPIGRTCASCHRPFGALTGTWSVGSYRDPTLRQAIAAFKYEEVRALADPLAAMLFTIVQRPEPSAWLARERRRTVLVPVSSDPARERQRGFDHTTLLADRLGRLLDLPVVHPFRRRRRQAQVGLTDDERRGNLRGAIQCIQPLAIFGKNGILVDDVITTGATALACASTLADNGARAVWALTLARG